MRMNKRKIRSLEVMFPLLVARVGVVCAGIVQRQCAFKRLARNAIEREAMFRDSSQVVKFDVGYYEIRPEMREALDTLVALGVINCKVEEVVEHRRFEKYTWWEGTKVYYKDVTHYFADVSLTESGEAYMVSDPPITRLGDDFTLSDSLLLSENSLLSKQMMKQRQTASVRLKRLKMIPTQWKKRNRMLTLLHSTRLGTLHIGCWPVFIEWTRLVRSSVRPITQRKAAGYAVSFAVLQDCHLSAGL